jgi:hypothetical protein
VEASSDFSYFQKGETSSVGNYRPIAILNSGSKISEFIVYDPVSHFLKSKLKYSQHGLIKSKFTG